VKVIQTWFGVLEMSGWVTGIERGPLSPMTDAISWYDSRDTCIQTNYPQKFLLSEYKLSLGE